MGDFILILFFSIFGPLIVLINFINDYYLAEKPNKFFDKTIISSEKAKSLFEKLFKNKKGFQ